MIEAAAPVFNRRGYWGSSLRDLMEATGLEKGGIYNHFGSKDELAEAAFAYNVELVGSRIRDALAGRRPAVDRLLAILEVYRGFGRHAPFVGGCPILNASVDADDTHPQLRARARQAMDDLRVDTLQRVVERGIERDELRRDIDASAVATILVATLEGGLMLNQLYGDPTYLNDAVDHLVEYVHSLALAETGA